MKIEKAFTGLTRQTWTQALSRLWDLEESGAYSSLDVVDDAGEVGHALIFIGRDGGYRARKGSPDPRNLYNRLKRDLRLRVLRLAVRPEE